MPVPKSKQTVSDLGTVENLTLKGAAGFPSGALVGFPLRVFSGLRGLLHGIFDVCRDKVGLTCGHSQSDSQSNSTGVLVVHGVLTQRQVGDSINNAHFAEAINENGFGFGVDNFPQLVANSDLAFGVVHENSPLLKQCLSRQQPPNDPTVIAKCNAGHA